MTRLFTGIILVFHLLGIIQLYAQDTFSIVAVDSVTGEVGSAGASCVDLFLFSGLETDFLGELFPARGAINTQAYYLSGNQQNARAQMNQFKTPQEIIDWLVDNDVQNFPQQRQYGIAALVDGDPQAAAHTGSLTDPFRGHIVGPNYSIQGNILSGQAVLDSMEARFLREEGDLACKLMAALQGANTIGADTRCNPNGTSSLFAFVKVAQPTDVFGSPSLRLSVKTADGQGIEPIDSLQTLFEQEKNCLMSSNEHLSEKKYPISIRYVSDQKSFRVSNNSSLPQEFQLYTVGGQLIGNWLVENELIIPVPDLSPGMYLCGGEGWYQKLWIK